MIPDALLKAVTSWRDADPDPSTAAELDALIKSANVNELSDRFAGNLEFGTAGLRGTLGGGPNRMNLAVVRRTTAGLARYLKAQDPDVKTRGVVVGRDGRRMSAEFLQETVCVLAAEGIPAHVFEDVIPTPVTAFALLKLKAAAAIMITASHNPPEYNGYKVYWGNGAQIIPPHDKGIAAAIDAVGPAREVKLLSPGDAKTKGLWRTMSATVERAYLDAILGLRLHPAAPKDFAIVYTAMHGVGGRLARQALIEAGFLNFNPVREQQEPDGGFPTVKFPNPEEPGAMDLSSALADTVKADLVLANDPDADRLAVLTRDGNGKLRQLTGNEVGVLLGHYALTQRKRSAEKKPLVVTTIVSSAQLSQIARAEGARYEETLTGFKWIANRALEVEQTEPLEFFMGYEEALGYTVGTVVRDKDGIGAALVFADLASWCKGRGTSVLGYLEEIQRRHGLFVADQKNFTFPGAEGAATIGRVMDGFRKNHPARIGDFGVVEVKDYKLQEATTGDQKRTLSLPSSNVIAYELDGGSRITLRPSGTEPKIKYYFELKEVLQPNEPMAGARERASSRMGALQNAFLMLARTRGQP